ncbi:hypothetical protein BDE02_03G183500 [Populus trichocarpa]|nr:hypothetical protein BDE02_03G183500 [Populus trichocarpa]
MRRKGGRQPLFWHGLKPRAVKYIQFSKRGEVLKPLVVKRFQKHLFREGFNIFVATNCKFCKRRERLQAPLHAACYEFDAIPNHK